MRKKEAAKINVAMDIIREACSNSAVCEGCPFANICDVYQGSGGKAPCDWEELFE